MTSIEAITMWVRSHIRRDWRALTLVTLSVAVAGGLAMTAGVGARRAGTAWKQLLARTNMPDVAKEVHTPESSAALDDLRSREGVTSAVRMSFMLVGLEGAPPTGGFVGRDPGFGTDIYRPIVLAGRAADPTRADELTIDPRTAEVTGLHPGDHIVLVSVPPAVHQPATVTGITVGPLDIGLNGGSPLMLLTPAFGAKWFDAYFTALPPPEQAAYRDVLMARTTSTATSARLIAENFIGGLEFAGNEVSAALSAEGTAYSVLSIAAAVGAALAIGQLVGRRVRRHADQAPMLAALGLTPGGRRLALAGPHVCAVGLGMLLVPAVAYIAVPLTNRGLLAQVDPAGDHVTDAVVMIGGTIVGLVVLVAVAVAAAWRADPRANGVSVHPAPRLMLPGPAGMFGARVAAGWAGRSGRAVARWHVAVLSVGVAAVAATLLWSGAARHVVATPARYGATWDAAVVASDDGTSPVDPVQRLDDAQNQLEANPAIGTILGRGMAGMLETDKGRVEVLQIDRAAGPWWPQLLAGRVPQNSHEITVGSGVLDAHTHLGDTVTIDGEPLTIVGEHVVPQWSNGEFGTTAAMIGGVLPPTDLDAPAPVMWVKLANGASLEQLVATVGEDVAVQSAADARPSDLTNVARIGGLDELLLVVCILLAFATLANGLVIATKSRQRDHRTMRALGADPSVVTGSVRWHTAIVVATSAVIGVPLGTIAGVTAWHHTAHAVFVGDAVHRPVLVTLLVLAGLFVAGAFVAEVTGGAAARRSRQRVTIE